MKSINETVEKMLFPFAAALKYDKGLHCEKIFHTEFKFFQKIIIFFKVVSDKRLIVCTLLMIRLKK